MISLDRASTPNPTAGRLRAPGAVLLVSCYELGRQPLGVAGPLALLEAAGFAPAALDVAVEAFDPARAGCARFVGISVPMHTALRLGVRIAARIREANPGCYVCFYGLYASLNADYLLREVADSVVGGEYQGPLVELVRALEAGDPRPIFGVQRRDGLNPPDRSPSLRSTPAPLPERRSLPALERYARLERDGRLELAGYVEASRGCKHMCRHCPIPPVYDGRFVVVPQADVLADIERLVEAGAAHITFGDPDFLNGPTHARRLVRALHHRFPRLTFDCTTKVEHILKHAELFPEFAESGCLFIVSAVESLSDTVLAHLDKGHTRADVQQALEILRGAEIALQPSLVSFTPWTTLDDYRDVLEWVAAEELVHYVDPVQYSIRLLVPPGSLLLESPAMTPYLGALDAEAFSYRWAHPDPEMDALHGRVSRVVEAAERDGEDAALTFQKIRALAGAPGPAPEAPRARRRPPRLTEAWFC